MLLAHTVHGTEQRTLLYHRIQHQAGFQGKHFLLSVRKRFEMGSE